MAPQGNIERTDRARIAITGASGFLGSALANHLNKHGLVVQRIRRGAQAVPPDVSWQPERGTGDLSALSGAAAVVHLAGASIAERWTSERKRAIMDSRVGPTSFLA